MADLEVIRIPEDPDIPKGIANKVFRAKEGSAFVVAWSPYRWQDAAKKWAQRTGRPAPRIWFTETDKARWDPEDRHAFPEWLQAHLASHPSIKLLVVSDDHVILPPGMPGGHVYTGHTGYCPICKLLVCDGEVGC